MLNRVAGMSKGLIKLGQCPPHRCGGSQGLGRVEHDGNNGAAGLPEPQVRSGDDGTRLAGPSEETSPVFRLSIVRHPQSRLSTLL
jgi:hypothetical protein